MGPDARPSAARVRCAVSSSPPRSPNGQMDSPSAIRAEGTAGVPLAVEICFREGGRLEGCRALRATPGSYVLPAGTATYRAGANQIRFGPGDAAHEYVQLRGAEPKLPGDSVYITGFTPFDRTVVFECL